MTKSRKSLISILAIAWFAALLIAFALDRRVATWVRDAVPVDKNGHLTHLALEALKLPGWFPFTCVVALLVGLFHRRHWLAAASLVASGTIVGAFYSIIKWIVGRHRPVIGIHPWSRHPFAGGLTGLWHPEAGLCFPSGHATLAFASAMCLAMLIPRFAWLFFVVAAVTATERVIENAHYVSDVVAGAGLGILVGWVVTRAILSVGSSENREASGFDVLPPAHLP